MSKVISRDGTTIALEQSGSGPTVILVDGAMGYREHSGGRPLANELSKEFTVITYDRRGRGESGDTLPYSVDREIEDIEALIDQVGEPVYLYGFSSGSVLGLKAAARLGEKIAKLAVFEPPFGPDDDKSRQEFGEFAGRMAKLLMSNRRGDAVAFFLSDMVPADMLERMRQSSEWSLMESVAPTLAYDNEVMGDGTVPLEDAKAVTMPALVMDGGESPEFKREAADALAQALPSAQRQTIDGEMTLVNPVVLAPLLVEFFQRKEK